MSAALEQQEQTVEGDGIEKTGIEVPADGTVGELFPGADYESEELALPKIDGEGVDKLAIAFSGSVLLDRSSPADVELMRKMRLGADVTLMVEVKCSAKGHKFATDREGELDAVVLEHRAKVHTVYRPAAGDELEASAA